VQPAAEEVDQTPPFVRLLAEATEQRRLKAVPSWRTAGGRTLQIGAQYWRLVSADAQRLRLSFDGAGPVSSAAEVLPADGSSEPVPAAASAASSAALHTARPRRLSPDVRLCRQQLGMRPDQREPLALSDGHQCVSISHFEQDPDAPFLSGSRLTAYVAVFPLATGQGEGPLKQVAPVASFSPFGRVRVHSTGSTWLQATEGPCSGWLLSAERREGSYLAAPWSTQALRALGDQIEQARQTRQSQAIGCVTPSPEATAPP
jgi:hypothetical protein